MTNAFVPVGSGISSQLMYCIEAFDSSGTWGICPASANNNVGVWRPLEFKSETMMLKKTTVQGQGLHAGGLFDRSSRRVLTNYDAGGTIAFDLPNRNLNAILMNMTGSPNSTAVGISAAGGGANKYIATQLTTTGAYQSYHSPGSTGGLSMCWQKGVPSADTPGATVVEPFTYIGCKISEWEFSCQTGAIVEGQLTIDARAEIAGASSIDPLLTTTVPTLVSFTETGVQGTGTANTGAFTDSLSVFHFREGNIFVGGVPTMTSGVLTLPGQSAAAANIKSASFKETHSLDNNRYFIGGNGFKAEQIENNFRKLTGSLVAEFLSAETYYAAFSQDTTTALQLTFVGGIAGTAGANADTISIIFPNVKLDGESPHIAGPGVITESAAFTGLDDNATVPYQIQYISSDAGV